MHIYLISSNLRCHASNLRPRPEALMPPNRATSLEIMPVLMPMMPYSSASPTRKTRQITGVEIGCKSNSVSLALRNHIGFIFKTEQRGEGPNVSSFDTLALAGTSTRMVGWKKLPPRSCALPPQTTRAPFSSASAICSSTFATAFHRSTARW